jgi:alkylation response protein AidB-like acyl-CoA dehydrogenase
MELPLRDAPLAGADLAVEALVAELQGAAAESFETVWRALGRHGLLRRFRGTASLAEACSLLEALGHRLDGLGVFLSVIAGCGLGLSLLEEAAGEGLVAEVYERALSGEAVLAVAITEPDAGSDALALATTLSARDASLRLDGHKWNITNAPVADHLVVFCRNVTGDQHFLSAVLVPRDSPGVEARSPQRLIGARGSPTGELVFRDVRVDPSWILGRPEDGRRLLDLAFLRERLLAPWALLGKMGRVVQEALDYVQRRRQFGEAIASYQYVQDKIVTSFEALETSRLLAAAALDACAKGAPSHALASLAKYHAMESAAQVFKAMIEVHGSYGVQVDARLGEYLADALCASIAGGTREIHKRVLFDQLVLDRARARRSGRSKLFQTTARPPERLR